MQFPDKWKCYGLEKGSFLQVHTTAPRGLASPPPQPGKGWKELALRYVWYREMFSISYLCLCQNVGLILAH